MKLWYNSEKRGISELMYLFRTRKAEDPAGAVKIWKVAYESEKKERKVLNQKPEDTKIF